MKRRTFNKIFAGLATGLVLGVASVIDLSPEAKAEQPEKVYYEIWSPTPCRDILERHSSRQWGRWHNRDRSEYGIALIHARQDFFDALLAEVDGEWNDDPEYGKWPCVDSGGGAIYLFRGTIVATPERINPQWEYRLDEDGQPWLNNAGRDSWTGTVCGVDFAHGTYVMSFANYRESGDMTLEVVQ